MPAKVWGYYIGGYQVIKKWLSYREKSVLGRPLAQDEAGKSPTWPGAWPRLSLLNRPWMGITRPQKSFLLSIANTFDLTVGLKGVF